jgi:hypothetical protein
MKFRGFIIRTPWPRVAPRALLAVAAVLALLTVAATPAAATGKGHNRGRVLTAVLTGEAETAGGDTDGIGVALVRVRAATGSVCYAVAVARVDTVTVAHIHVGAAGVAGPVVLPLTAPVDGFARDCATVDPALAAAIVANPAGYYVNVHSAAFPAGAVRGQLRSHHRH